MDNNQETGLSDIYCQKNFDLGCPRYAHFNRLFFKWILFLRKLNIDIIDVAMVSLVVFIITVAYLIKISEVPIYSVLRYYRMNYAKPTIVEPKPSGDGRILFDYTPSPPETPISTLQREVSFAGQNEGLSEQERWVYTLLKYSLSSKNKDKVIVKDWISALNECAKKFCQDQSINLSFDSIDEKSRTPKISKLRADTSPSGAQIVVGHLETRKLTFKLLITSKQTNKPSSSNSNGSPKIALGVLEPLIGELMFSPYTDTLGQYHVTGSFMGRPSTKVVITKFDLSETPDYFSQLDNSIIEGLVYQCVANVAVDVNLSKVRVPTVIAENLAQSVQRCVSNIMEESQVIKIDNNALLAVPAPRIRPRDKRLLVKIIKANNLNAGEGADACNPFCSLEIDFPSQKHRTNTIHSTNNPFWDEHFLFDITHRTKDLVLTVYDRDRDPGSDLLGRCRINVAECRRTTVTKRTLDLENPYNPSIINPGSITIEIMLMGQSSEKAANRDSLQLSVNNGTPASSSSPASPQGSSPGEGREGRGLLGTLRRGRNRSRGSSQDRDSRSRSRSKSKAIKDWFSRRDRSLDQSRSSSSGEKQPPLIVRLRSKDQLSTSSQTSVTNAHNNSAVLSETSSINSRNSFVNYDHSTLVIESDGKYFLISKELAKSGKHGIKGLKLHVYNDHTFVATHFSKTETCEVCLKPISKRLGVGKQGYRCRDCEYTCHKGCHFKTELICANSQVNNMEMQFVGEPPVIVQQTIEQTSD